MAKGRHYLTKENSQVLAEISVALNHPYRPPWGPRKIWSGPFNGDGGYALFYAYLAAALPKQRAKYHTLVYKFLQRAINELLRTGDPGLAGTTGNAWIMAHLLKNKMGPWGQLRPLLADFDRALYASIKISGPHSRHDLSSGLAGFGLYALERLPHRMGAKILTRVVQFLEASAVSDRHGSRWKGPPGTARYRKGINRYLLSAYYGCAGPVAILAAAQRNKIAATQASRLLQDVLRWMWAQRVEVKGNTLFPVEEGKPEVIDVWSLDKGNIGIATVLLGLRKNPGLEVWANRGERILTQLAVRTPPAGLKLAGLDGAAGVAHVFDWAYRITQRPLFREASEKWLKKTLRMRRAGAPAAGFQTWIPAQNQRLLSKVFNDPRVPQGWEPCSNFGTGAAGVGLTLMSTMSDIPPSWERILLLSL